MDWKEASWVMVPSLRVSRQGCVTPLLEGLFLITSAVWRNCLIWSLVSADSSAAGIANVRTTQVRTTKEALDRKRGDSRTGGHLTKLAPTLPRYHLENNTNRCAEGARVKPAADRGAFLLYYSV